MFINNFDPVAIQILSLELRWYSLSYIVGILLCWFFAKKIFINNESIRSKFDDYISYLIIGIIIGILITIAIFNTFGPIAGIAWVIFGLIFGYITRER